jgi:hypothetical protein
MRTSKQLTLYVVLAGLLVANGMPSAWAQSRHRAVRPGSGEISTTKPTKGVVFNYECKSGTCTCSSPQDCSVMGADHVCQDKSFVGSGTGGGSCLEKVN